MLAAVTQSPGVLTLDELPDPGPPGPQEVLIRPEVVGICGSDLHVYHGELGARSFFPRVQGHEFSAIIEAAGQDCPAGLRPGERCGRCAPAAAATRAGSAARLVHAHQALLAALLTHRFPLAQAQAAIECVVTAADAIKVLVTIDGQADQEERHE